ncbi:MAG: 4'-phosphopantetheinyl transferase superfamily protein, partial [Bacteroidota bacterium]
LLAALPASMHSRALRYRREEDAYNFILGRLLLKQGLADLQSSETIANLSFEESGKPVLPSVFFNLSHTDGLVVCGVSKAGPIGIDVEKIKAVELANFVAFFKPMEWRKIQEAALPRQQFYRYWTRKESIIKALGLSLASLHQIEVEIEQDTFVADGKTWYLQELSLGAEYVGAICSEALLEMPIPIKQLYF